VTPSRVVRRVLSSAAIAGLLATAAPDSDRAEQQPAGAVCPQTAVGRQDAGFPRHLADRGTAYVNVEGHPGEKGLAASRSIVVDPPDGKIPYRRDALTRRQTNYRNRSTADPSLKCYQASVPRATYLATPLQILQSPGNFAIVYQENHAFRVFHPDTRPHFDATDWWMGDTRYRWEGDTLVADVAAITDQAWLDQAGNFHSTEFHVVERYRMTGPDVIEYEARIDDPVVYARPGRCARPCTV
jgi:hypothetical protein